MVHGKSEENDGEKDENKGNTVKEIEERNK